MTECHDDDELYGEESMTEYGDNYKSQFTPSRTIPSARRHSLFYSPKHGQGTSEPGFLRKKINLARRIMVPLLARHYPLVVIFYISIFCLLGYTFFGATPGVVKETVLEPIASSVGDFYDGIVEAWNKAPQVAAPNDSTTPLPPPKRIDLPYTETREDITKEVFRQINRSIISERLRMDEILDMMKKEWMNEISSIKEDMRKTSDELHALRSDVDGTKKILTSLEDSLREKDSVSAESILNKEEYSNLKQSIDNNVKEVSRLVERMGRYETERNTVSREGISIDSCDKEKNNKLSIRGKGLTNMASIIHGATIIKDSTSRSFDRGFISNLFCTDNRPFYVITERNQLEPGQCMPLSGSTGNVSIKLSHPGRISHIEYSHVYWRKEDGIPSSAPKEITVIGCNDDDTNEGCEKIASCIYTEMNTVDGREEASYSVTVDCPLMDDSSTDTMKSVRIVVKSNHGGDHTCIYLMRIFGTVSTSEESNSM